MQNLKRRLRGWRTVVFGAAVALLGLLDALSALDITPLLPEGKAGAAMAVIGLVTVFLRFVTTGPVGAAPRRQEPDWEQG